MQSTLKTCIQLYALNSNFKLLNVAIQLLNSTHSSALLTYWHGLPTMYALSLRNSKRAEAGGQDPRGGGGRRRKEEANCV
jgi:hypothetical protein